jgi:predicted RNase H-related nuclease YkuK (DUF458 family)
MTHIWNDAKSAIAASPKDSSVYIGCDSIRYRSGGKWKARYSTVVILHRSTRSGCQLFYHTETLHDYGNLKQRLLTEVSYAVSAASEIVDVLDGRYMEIHLDVNPNPKHKSSIAVKEALGYVQGSGFIGKVKPESWAATHVADHVARQ